MDLGYVTFPVAVPWGDGRRPLEGVGFPGVGLGLLPFEDAQEKIGEEYQLGGPEDEGADRDEGAYRLQRLEVR